MSVLKSQLRLVACFFVSCALLAYGLNALLLLEHAAGKQTLRSHSFGHEAQAHFDWISREQPDEACVDLSAIAGSDFLASTRLVFAPAAEIFPLAASDFSNSPAVLLSRPPPVI